MVTRYDTEIKYEGRGRISTSKMVEYNDGKYVTHADYKALKEDHDSWRRVAEYLELKRGECSREILRLTAELAECRADALRYRFLRDAPATVHSEPIRNWLWTRPFGANMKVLDEAIDIARSKA